MSTPAERATVLAVDDLPEYRRLYERRLGDDYEVLTAESGEAALRMLDDRIDVVLLDRSMPDMSGDEVLATIRAEGYPCRVAMVTANEPDDDVIDLGFDAYLVKPVTTGELNRTVQRLLARTSYEAHMQELFTLCVERARADPNGELPSSEGEVPTEVGTSTDGRASTNGQPPTGEQPTIDGQPSTDERASAGAAEPKPRSGENVDEDSDDDLAALEDRIREVRDTVDETVERFETADYRASFRDLPDLE